MDRNSPTVSDTSSDTPENDEYPRTAMMESEETYSQPGLFSNSSFRSSGGSTLSALTSFTNSIGSFTSNSKKRMQAMPVSGSSSRDSKTRKKDMRGSMWEQGFSSRSIRGDETVDVYLVDQLRNQFGDPFDDKLLQKVSTGN